LSPDEYRTERDILGHYKIFEDQDGAHGLSFSGESKTLSPESTRAMILLDMMGYKNLELGRDPTSTKWLQDIIWQTGRQLGYEKVFVDREEGVGGDDHEPFLGGGVAAVDIIQLTSYPHWHRADDTIDKVSAQSMKIVGETILASLPKVTEYVIKNNPQAPNPKTIQE